MARSLGGVRCFRGQASIVVHRPLTEHLSFGIMMEVLASLGVKVSPSASNCLLCYTLYIKFPRMAYSLRSVRVGLYPGQSSRILLLLWQVVLGHPDSRAGDRLGIGDHGQEVIEGWVKRAEQSWVTVAATAATATEAQMETTEEL